MNEVGLLVRGTYRSYVWRAWWIARRHGVRVGFPTGFSSALQAGNAVLSGVRPYPCSVNSRSFEVIVIGGGHAGVEAAWAAANILREAGSVALVTLDPSRIGVMSCNPAIGGLAKGQIVREVDALNGLMGLATDATGIQFKVLNTSKGPAVHGPRAQCDKHAYAEEVQRLIGLREEIVVVGGSVERLVVEGGRVCGVQSSAFKVQSSNSDGEGGVAWTAQVLSARAVVLTTGTFMRGLMHTGEQKTPGGRFGEDAAVGISGALKSLGFELGRLKTGTPPRLKRGTIQWEALEPQHGDAVPAPFSDLTGVVAREDRAGFPRLPQVECRITETTAAIHASIRANLHRAPMYSGQIESVGPRYCPSIEDKVVRFGERESHHVYLEPESLRDDWIYCNGISTSLPADVQDAIVRGMRGCERAEILRYGYAVEYDMVRPHQISATGMTKLVEGLFLAGQINGTSGYEEAAGQGLVAGMNAARFARGQGLMALGREQAYIGVMMDDLVTKTPVEPYRMFTSRAEHRLSLRSDNAPDRLTALAEELGLLGDARFGAARRAWMRERTAQIGELNAAIERGRLGGRLLSDYLRRPEFGVKELVEAVGPRRMADGASQAWRADVLLTVHTDRFYEAYIEKSRAEVRRSADLERKRIPPTFDYDAIANIRTEARHALKRFRPETLGQAGRLEGMTPADVTLLSVLIGKRH